MKIAFILGTRPEIIKMAPVIRACEKSGHEFYIVHSNQHYSKEMDQLIFEDLKLDSPKYNLEVGSGPHGQQTGRILEKVESVLMEEVPDAVLVHGDVNTSLAGALAARKLLIPVGHVEAGLRSRDITMPEEVNRTLVDHISDFLFAPTIDANNNLIREGILTEKVFVTGNTIVDACYQHKQLALEQGTGEKFGIEGDYFLLTLHRAENTDNYDRLQAMISALDEVANKYETTLLYPIHPRTRKRLEEFEITLPESFTITEPLGYLDFLNLIINSRLVLTDSGGIQEEACILEKTCVTLRENTERPESVEVGANMLAGVTREGIINAVDTMYQQDRRWVNPFGDGKTAEIIIETLEKKVKT